MILDTHALLWMDRNDPALGLRARRQIEAEWRSGQLAVSAISFWEAAMLAERGRITLPMSAALWREDWIGRPGGNPHRWPHRPAVQPTRKPASRPRRPLHHRNRHRPQYRTADRRPPDPRLARHPDARACGCLRCGLRQTGSLGESERAVEGRNSRRALRHMCQVTIRRNTAIAYCTLARATRADLPLTSVHPPPPSVAEFDSGYGSSALPESGSDP